MKTPYDYSATTEEEFDILAGDIIAVTETPVDGWWIGELLDKNRRQKGPKITLLSTARDGHFSSPS